MTPLSVVELRRVVRADPGAVAAADALLGIEDHRAGRLVAVIGGGRAAERARRRIAVIAGETQMPRRQRRMARRIECHQLPPAGVDTPVVLDPARDPARLARRAAIGIELERRAKAESRGPRAESRGPRAEVGHARSTSTALSWKAAP